MTESLEYRLYIKGLIEQILWLLSFRFERVLATSKNRIQDELIRVWQNITFTAVNSVGLGEFGRSHVSVSLSVWLSLSLRFLSRKGQLWQHECILNGLALAPIKKVYKATQANLCHARDTCHQLPWMTHSSWQNRDRRAPSASVTQWKCFEDRLPLFIQKILY